LSENAREIGKTPEYAHQLVTGVRGFGRFPPPECHLTDIVLLWAWCAVSFWPAQNNIVQPDVVEDLDTAYLINNALEELREGRCPQPTTTEHLKKELAALYALVELPLVHGLNRKSGTKPRSRLARASCGMVDCWLRAVEGSRR